MSHLTVSYVSQTPAGTPAGATTSVAPAADSPLGFLAALVDQLLAGGAEAAKTQIAGTTGVDVDVPGLLNATIDASTATSLNATAQPGAPFAALGLALDELAANLEAGEAPSPAQLQDLRSAIADFSAAIDAEPAVPAATPDAPVITAAPEVTTVKAIGEAEIVQLLAKLGLIEPPQTAPTDKPAAVATTPADPVANVVDRLLALSKSLAATAPELAQKLEALAAKIEAKPEVAVQLGLVVPEPDTDAATIANIIRTLLGRGNEDTAPADKPKQGDVAGAPTAEDDLLKILATLGLSAPPVASATDASVEAAASTPAATTVPAPLVRLSDQLSKVAAELAATSPELAKKLETVATQLVSGNVEPELLGKLTSAAAQPSGTALDKLVQSLIDPKPVPITTVAATTPQISATAELVLPAPTAPKQSKSAVAEVKAAPPEPASVTADSAPKPAQNVTLATTAQEPAGDAKPEAKAEAKVAAIIADTAKADPAGAQPMAPQQQPPVTTAQQARVLPAAYQSVANPINMGQVAFEMARQVQQGSSRFTIRLDPPELGRVDVKMQVDASGAVNARLTVDRAETLDLFQRDRQSLERALSQAGLDASKTNLEFSLRQQNQNPFSGMMGGDQHHHQPGHGAQRFASREADDIAALPAVTLYRGTASAAGVNIFA